MTRSFLTAALLIAVFARTADAGTLLFGGVTPVDDNQGQIAVVVGAIDRGAGHAVLGDIEIDIGGTLLQQSVVREGLNDYARKTQDGEWQPPMIVGVLYLWAEQTTPPEVLDGIQKMFRRVPPRTLVLPKPFGYGNLPVIANVPASRVAGGDLGEYEYIKGDSIQFLQAAEQILSELSVHAQPLKLLVIVGDGRDFKAVNDATAFRKFGERVAAAGVVTQVISFPSQSDEALCHSNMENLAAGAGARHLVARRVADLPTLIDGAGVMFSDMQRLVFDLPMMARLKGGTTPVRVAAMVGSERLHASLGKFILPGGAARLPITGTAAFILVVVGGAVVALMFFHRTRSAPSSDLNELIADVDDLILRGGPLERAVVELSSWHPTSVQKIASLDIKKINQKAFRFARSRAGRARYVELQALLSQDTESGGLGDGELMRLLADGLATDQTATHLASSIAARVPDTERAAFSRMDVKTLAKALAAAAAQNPILSKPRARAFALDVQDQLCNTESVGVAVAWLVRSMGAGLRGETLPLAGDRTVIGSARSCHIVLVPEYEASDEHAEIALDRRGFVIRPLAGAVKLEGKLLQGPRPISDGESLQIGKGLFVFKAVLDG